MRDAPDVPARPLVPVRARLERLAAELEGRRARRAGLDAASLN